MQTGDLPDSHWQPWRCIEPSLVLAMVYMGREGQCIWQQTCKCVRIAEDIGCVRDKGLHWFSSDSCRDRALYLQCRCAVQSATFTKNNSPSTGLRLKEEVKSSDCVSCLSRVHFPCLSQLSLCRDTVRTEVITTWMAHTTKKLSDLNKAPLLSRVTSSRLPWLQGWT